MRHLSDTAVASVAALLAIGVLADTSGATAQAAREVVTDRLTVTAVEIPVQVLRQGQPLAGLTAADFEVFDRGEPQSIIDFGVLDLTDSEVVDSAPAVEEEGSDRPARARHLLLLIDFAFTDWSLLPRAIRGAQEVLSSRLHPTDELAIGFLSPTLGMQLLHDFTTERRTSHLALELLSAMTDRDASTAGAALGELAETSGLQVAGVDGDEPRWAEVARRWIASVAQPIGMSPLPMEQRDDSLALSAGGRGLSIVERSIDPVLEAAGTSTSLYDERLLRRLLFVGKALRDAMRSLAAPEPKQVLLLSSGIPSRFLDSRDHSTRVLARLEIVVKACLESGWVVNAIDVRGVPSVEEGGFEGNSLFHLARHTGGQLYENFNNTAKAAGRALERTSLTYVLVIQPRVESDGSFHELEVRLKAPRRGDRLLYRPAYRAPTPEDRITALDSRRDVAQLILGPTDLEDFEMDLLAVSPPAIAGRAWVPVVVEVPGEVLLENPFGDSVSVEIHAYAIDATGGVQDLFIRRIDFELERARSRLRRGGLRIAGHLGLGPGAGEIRVLLRNLANDAISMARTPVDVPSLSEQSVFVLPPLFVDRSRDWLSVRVSEDIRVENELPALSDTIAVDYFPKVRPVLTTGRSQELMLNLFFSGSELPRLEIQVLTALGDPVEGARIRLVRRWADTVSGMGLVATVQPRRLLPGGYQLEVALTDLETGRRVARRQRFVVEEGN